MVALTILAQFGILYLLVAIPWRVPLAFRLLLGLIITWPTLCLYGEFPLPAGIPDLNYQRGYVALLLVALLITEVLTRNHGYQTGLVAAGSGNLSPVSFPSALHAPRLTKPVQGVPIEPADFSARYDRSLTAFPLAVMAYVILKLITVCHGLLTGVGDATVIAGYLDNTIAPVILYYLTKRFVDSKKHLIWLVGAIVTAATIVCWTGMFEVMLDLQQSAFPIPAHDDAGNTRYLDAPGGRASGVFGSPSVFGGVVGLGLLTSLACMVHVPGRVRKVVLASVALVLAYGVFATFTRSVWISVAFALLCAQFYFKDLWKVIVPAALCGVVALGVMWSVLQDNELVQDRLLNEENVTGRVDRFIWSAERFLESPFIGRGPGALDDLMRGHFLVDGFATSHNTFMSILVDHGVIVFLLFCTVTVRWLFKAKSVLLGPHKRSFEASVVAAMAGFLAIWLLSGMSTELRYFYYYTALFWIAGAVIERLSDVCATDEQASSVGVVGE